MTSAEYHLIYPGDRYVTGQLLCTWIADYRITEWLRTQPGPISEEQVSVFWNKVYREHTEEMAATELQDAGLITIKKS